MLVLTPFFAMQTMRTPPPASQGVKSEPKKLFNHTPQPLPPDDLYRAEHIPLKKGACWRDLGILSADKTRKRAACNSQSRAWHGR